jgi:hypothetical protein
LDDKLKNILHILLIFCFSLTIFSCAKESSDDSTTTASSASSTSMPDYETTTLSGKIDGTAWTFYKGRVTVPTSSSGKYYYNMTSDNISNACSSTYTGTSSNPYILAGRDDAPAVGEEEFCFSSGCSKTVTFYDGYMNYIIATGKIKIDTVNTTEVTGKMYAKGSDSDNEINGTFTLSRCCLSSGSYSLCSESDTTAPTLAEVTAVTALTNDTTPDYTFSSTEAGTITYGGSCTSSITSASSGNNAITFSTLSNGTYDNCTVMVTDNALNSSSNLSVSTFTVDNTTISSSASDNASVGFGQTYQYQLTTSSTFSGTITYSLSNQPDNMTISSSGLVEWTPTKASEITTHSNITITLTTASGFVLTETYDLTVTGTCTSGNVLAIWSGDQRSSTDSSKFLGNITAYTDNASDICGRSNNLDCTPSNNYEYDDTNNDSENLHIGPTPSATKGNMFFYNQYDNTSNTYLFWMFGKGGTAFSDPPNYVHLDVFTASNTSSDSIIVSDDGGETNRESQSESSGLYSSTYTGRYAYNTKKSDGGVLGPFTGTTYRIFVDLVGKSLLTSSHSTNATEELGASGVSGNDLGLGNLDSFTYWSKDNSSFALGAVDNFTVGYKTSIDCSN